MPTMRRFLTPMALTLSFAALLAPATARADDLFAGPRRQVEQARQRVVDEKGLAAPMQFVLMTDGGGGRVEVVDLDISDRILNSVPDTLRLMRDLWMARVAMRPPADNPPAEQALLMAWRPDERVDMRVQAGFADLEMAEVRIGLVSAAGEARWADDVRTDAAFFERFGRHFNVRAAWRDLVGKTMRGNRVQVHQLSDDYRLLFSPPVRTPMQRANMEGQIADIVDIFRIAYPDFLLIALVDVERLRFALPENYRSWLGAEAARVAQEQVKADALIDPGRFIRLAIEQIDRTGLRVEFEDGACFVGDGDVYVRIPMVDALVKTVHAGLSFEQGVHRYVCQPLQLLPRMKALRKAIDERAGAAYDSRISMGQRMLFTERATGQAVRRAVDLMDMAARVDPANGAALDDYLRRAAGFDPATARFAARDMTPGQGNVPMRIPMPKNEAQMLAGLGYRVTFDDDFGYIVLLAFEDGDREPLTRDDFDGPDAEIDTAVSEAVGQVAAPVEAHGVIRLGGERLRVAAGADLSVVWTEPRLARSLLASLLDDGDAPPTRTFLFAVSRNVVVFSPNRLDDAQMETASAQALRFARAHGIETGPSLFGQQSMRLPREGAGSFRVKE